MQVDVLGEKVVQDFGGGDWWNERKRELRFCIYSLRFGARLSTITQLTRVRKVAGQVAPRPGQGHGVDLKEGGGRKM